MFFDVENWLWMSKFHDHLSVTNVKNILQCLFVFVKTKLVSTVKPVTHGYAQNEKVWMNGQIYIWQAAKKKYIFIMKLKGKFWSPAVCLQYVLPHEPLLSILNSRPNDDFDIWWPYFNTFPHQITKRKIRPKLERRGHVFIHTWADFLFVCNRGDTVQYHSGLRSRVLGQAPCYWCS